MSDNKVKIGNLIFDDIESNSYLNNLYEKALVSYAKKTLQITNCTSMLNNKKLTICSVLLIYFQNQTIMKNLSIIKCGHRRLLFY